MVRMNKYILIALNSPWPQRLLRIVIGIIFIHVGYKRILIPHMVAEHLMILEIFPWSLINIVAMWLLCFEIFIGAFVITGIWLRSCSILLIGFCIICLGLITYALINNISLHCGCFVTSATGTPRTWGSLWQEGILLLGCVCLWSTTLKRDYNYTN